MVQKQFKFKMKWIILKKNKNDVGSSKEFLKNDKLILKTQQRFKSERNNIFTEEINKDALSPSDDKRIQSIYLIETYG